MLMHACSTDDNHVSTLNFGLFQRLICHKHMTLEDIHLSPTYAYTQGGRGSGLMSQHLRQSFNNFLHSFVDGTGDLLRITANSSPRQRAITLSTDNVAAAHCCDGKDMVSYMAEKCIDGCKLV